jgi:parallel beta-helix repeat protein
LARDRRIVLVVVLALSGALTFGASDAGACTRWVSDRGSDGNGGSAEAPFRNVQTLVDSLSPGEVGCLAAGSIFAERVRIGQPAIQLRSAPGRRATIRGGIRVFAGADNVVLSSLVLQGADVGERAIVVIESNGVRLVRNDISGPFLLNQSAPCVLLDGAIGTVLDGNAVHACTRVTRRAIYSAGIVAMNASATTIRSNFVFRAAGDGIVLAPNAQGSILQNNVIDGNVGGIFLGGSSRGNRIVDNVISFSGRYNVHASFAPNVAPEPENVVGGNCLWRGAVANLAGAGPGFRAVANLVASPRYLNRPASHAMRPGPCYLKRPLSLRGGRFAVLPRFLVRYRLRALPGRVQVVRLELVGLASGVQVDLRCVRRCGTEERLSVSRGRAASSRLRGLWLKRGAVIEVRARKSWWIGHYARITVTGLPNGVRIEHACLPLSGSAKPVSCGRYR